MRAVSLAVLSCVSFGVPARAATLEAVRARAAAFAPGIPVRALAEGDTDAERTLRLARKASERAYRLTMDLGMMSRTAAEASALAADPARRERLEFLLKFLVDAFPVQGDGAAFVLDKVLWLKYELGKPEAPELPGVVREMVERVGTADAAAKALRRDCEALKAAVDAANAGERSAWLAERLVDSGVKMDDYTAYLKEKAGALRP